MPISHRCVLPLVILMGLMGIGATQRIAAGADQPAPKYGVTVERNVAVRMRDGVTLRIDLYIPTEGGRPIRHKVPAVLQRTPYNKDGFAAMASFFAGHGYLSAVQDCRGRDASDGEFFPFVNEPHDGYDTIQWLAAHDRCDGKVGTYGCSYMAWVQFEAATQNPPALKTMIPYEGPTNAYHYSMRTGGALHLGLLKWVLEVAQTSKEARQNPAAAKAVAEMSSTPNFLKWADRIPWRRGDTPLAAFPAYEDAAFKLYFENNDYSDFWRQPGLGMDEHFESFPDIPILWVVGWYDWYPRTICDGYGKMLAAGRKNQHLLVGPWTHNNFDPSCGDVNFGDADFAGTNAGAGGFRTYDDFLHLELRWFDRWLKGDASADVGQPAQFFLMGGGDGRRGDGGRLNHGGRWVHADAWPPEGVQPAPFYLRAGGGLSRDKPTGADPASATSYTYDPRDTVSSNGRCIIAYGPAAERGFSGMGPRDQVELETLPGHGNPGMPIASRPDVLVFRTPPLEQDARIAGDVTVTLHASSDAPDTDFFVKLIDEYPAGADHPAGYAFPVTEGILRARYRDGFEKPSPMKPGDVYRLHIPLEPSANLFKAGHRIRLDVCSSNFPNFDINRNAADPAGRRRRVAENTVHHDAQHPSCITLPLWPDGD